jgi:hypothetical protein
MAHNVNKCMAPSVPTFSSSVGKLPEYVLCRNKKVLCCSRAAELLIEGVTIQ